MANWGNIVDFNNNANSNTQKVEGEIMTTPTIMGNVNRFQPPMSKPVSTPTIIVPEDKQLEAKMLLEQLGQDWQTARQTSGMYGMYRDRTILTTHWDWDDRRDVTLVGRPIQEGTKDLETVRKICDHNWNAEEHPIMDDISGIRGFKSIRRSDHKIDPETGEEVVLHVANGKYTCIQNDTFYLFAKEMIDFGFNCRNGGTFNNGQMIFLSMKADNYQVCGEPFESFAVLSNSFNGSKPFALYFTDVRIVCLNTYMCATQAKNAVFSVRHTSKADWYIPASIEAMRTQNNHRLEFKQNMEALAMKPVTDDFMWEMAKAAFPVESKDKDKVRALKSVMDKRNEFMFRYLEAPDLAEHRGTAYAALGAMTDWDDHHDRKNTKNSELNQFKGMLGGKTYGAWAYDYLTR